MKRIIGIDPGLLRTGWGIIESVGNSRIYVSSGVIRPSAKLSLAERLSQIFSELMAITDLWQPDQMAIEITFVNKNPETSLLLGHARGAAMLAFGIREIQVFEYEANKIKRAISATGHADKEQISRMVYMLLPSARAKINTNKSDETDALAIALAHSNLIVC